MVEKDLLNLIAEGRKKDAKMDVRIQSEVKDWLIDRYGNQSTAIEVIITEHLSERLAQSHGLHSRTVEQWVVRRLGIVPKRARFLLATLAKKLIRAWADGKLDDRERLDIAHPLVELHRDLLEERDERKAVVR